MSPGGRGITLAIAIALVTAACAGPTAAPSPAPPRATPAAAATPAPRAPDKVTFLTDFLLWGWHSPFFAAKAQKFFADEGLDVTIQAGKGSVDTGAQLAAGTVQFALIDVSTAMLAIGRGADIRLIGVQLQKHPGGLLYLKERTTIRSWKDIEGKRIGGATGDAYLVALPGLMKQNNADSSKYRHIAMEPAVTSGALIAGQVDAIPGSPMTAPPRATAAKKEGLTLERFSFADNGYKAVGFAVATNGKTLKDQPDLAQRFVRAWAKANLWSIENAEKAVADFLTANPDKQKAEETESFSSSVPLIRGFGTFFKFDPARLKENVDFVTQSYNVTLKLEDTFTNQFVDKLPAGYTEGRLR